MTPTLTLLISVAATASLLSTSAAAENYLTFSADCEAELAYSALPSHLRDRANAYVLGKRGAELRGPDDADFSCIVARNHPGSIIPQCFDRPGQSAILPKYLDEAQLLRAGATFDEIRHETEKRLERGAYKPTSRPGLVYMMSAYNYIYGTGAQRILHVHPHVMFHAPNLEPEAVGNTFAQGMQNTGLPFVIDSGPHGYMVSMVDRSSDSAGVEEACAGQLPPPPGNSQARANATE